MVGLLEISITLVAGYVTWLLVGFWWRYRKICHLVKDFTQPGPCHPLLGHVFLFKDLSHLMEKKESLAIVGRHPKMIVIWFSFIPMIQAIHPDTAKIIFKSSFPKPQGRGQAYSIFKTFCGEGLVVSNGKKWERNRKLLTPAFHFDVLRPYVTIYNEAADILLEKFANQMAENPKSIQISEALDLATLDIILRCSLSYEGNIQRQENHSYTTAIHEIGKLTMARLRNPFHFLSWTLYKRSTNGQSYVKHVNFIHKFAEELIAKRKKTLADDPSALNKRKLDFLDILLTAKDENGQGLSDEDIRDEVDTFMFAGHDTTRCALLWAFYHLGKYPDEQEKVYKEVCDVIGDNTYVEWDDLGKLSILTMFLKENLRLFPPAGGTTRLLTEDVEFDGVTIPAGTSVGVNIVAIHRNKEIYPDPSVFKPERFLPENAENRHQFAYIPFSAGARNCIGKNFSINEQKVLLARVLKRFKVVLDEDHLVTPSSELVLVPKHGIKVRFEER